MKKISSEAVIFAIRLQHQVSAPATPDAGYSVIYTDGVNLLLKDPAGVISTFTPKLGGGNLLYNGGFEIASGNTFAQWYLSPGTGAITQENTIVYSGTKSIKVRHGVGGSVPYAGASLYLQAGHNYRFLAYGRGDGVNNVAEIHVIENGGTYRALSAYVHCGTSTTWGPGTADFTVPSDIGISSVMVQVTCNAGYESSAYFDQCSVIELP